MKYTLIPVFLLIYTLKNGAGTFPALKNELLQKILSRVGYKKDNCTPHMHNVVQNNMSSSIPHKSKMTINRGRKLFYELKNLSIRLFLTYSKLPTPPKLSIPLHQKNQLKTLLQRKKTVLSRAIGKRTQGNQFSSL